MTVRKLENGNKKPWLCELYPQGRKGKRVHKRFAINLQQLCLLNTVVAQRIWIKMERHIKRLTAAHLKLNKPTTRRLV